MYIEGNDWCADYAESDLIDYFNIEFIEVGEDNEITQLIAEEDNRFGEQRFGYYSNEAMAMVGGTPDRIRASEGAEVILTSNEDHVRSAYHDGGGAFRTYGQSICFLGMSNENDFDRAEFLTHVIDELAGYQGSIYGQVVNDHTGEPIEGATITIESANLYQMSDEDGIFEFSRFPLEQFTLSAEAEGFMIIRGAEYNFNGEQEMDLQVRMIDPETVESEGSQPHDFNIASIYPNPFNPITTVKFALERVRDVEISVYDISGNEMMTTVMKQLPQGEHRATFDAQSWSTGVYIFRLSDGHKSSVLKGALVK